MFWLTMLRAGFALVLGVAILAVPDKATPMLANFMGLYWLASGALNLKDLHAGRLRRRWLGASAGWLAVAVGIAVLVYSLVLGREASSFVVVMLGLVILLTGLIHMGGGFESMDAMRMPVRLSLVIGGIEVLLGVVLVLSPASRPDVAFWLVAAWALAASITLVAAAFYLRSQATAK